VSIPHEDDSLDVGVLTPTNDLANQLCDFPEALWTGAAKAVISLSNWGSEPVTLANGQQVGLFEPAGIVSEDDPVWKDSPVHRYFRVRIRMTLLGYNSFESNCNLVTSLQQKTRNR